MSASDPLKIDRQTTTPFLLKLFYRTGSFHRLDEFSPRGPLPPHLQIYTWQSCTLRELTHLLTTALPSLLPRPSTGTRLSYRLVFADTRDPRPGPARFHVKDLGSVIVGSSSSQPTAANGDTAMDIEGAESKGEISATDDGDRTLHGARFVIGDYVEVAVLPPLADGSVAAPPLPTPLSAGPPSGPPSGGFRRGGDGGGRPPRENGFGPPGGGFGRRGGRFDGPPRGGGVPTGEWRRGERLPEYGGSGGGGGFGRGRGRRGGY